jgi:hypothetical protein
MKFSGLIFVVTFDLAFLFFSCVQSIKIKRDAMKTIEDSSRNHTKKTTNAFAETITTDSFGMRKKRQGDNGDMVFATDFTIYTAYDEDEETRLMSTIMTMQPKKLVQNTKVRG